MEGEARHLRVRFANSLPFAIPENLATHGASSIFDDWQIMLAGCIENSFQIARHAHLVHTENCLGSISNRRFDFRRVDIKSTGLDVNEHGQSATVPYAIGC